MSEIDANKTVFYECVERENKLDRVEKILEFYANSKIGTLQENGTYKIDCGNGIPQLTYDPRPAKEGLKLLKGERLNKMFKDTGNGNTNFCLNCELLQRKFDYYKDVKEFEIARYKECLYEIEEICKNECYLNVDSVQEDILQKIKEVRGE